MEISNKQLRETNTNSIQTPPETEQGGNTSPFIL